MKLLLNNPATNNSWLPLFKQQWTSTLFFSSLAYLDSLPATCEFVRTRIRAGWGDEYVQEFVQVVIFQGRKLVVKRMHLRLLSERKYEIFLQPPSLVTCPQ